MQLKFNKPQFSTLGMVAHYKLWAGLTTAAELFDYSLDGLAGTAMATDIVPAYPGFVFNGSSSVITTGNDPITQADVSNGITLAAWFNTFTLAIGSYRILSIESVCDLYFFGNADKAAFFLDDGGAAKTLFSDSTFVTNTWFFWAGTWDGTTMRCYRNGVLQSNTDTPSVPSFDTQNRPITIGRHASGASQFFNGKIDDVMIFNTAKSEADLKSIYEITRSRYGV